MSGFEVKGWCPGALRPMISGDGLVVRVRPHTGRLSAVQAAGLAAAAEAYGNGLIDLSARANVQLRGIADGAHGDLLAKLAALGLLDRDIATETHRNLIVTPLWQPGDGTADLAEALEAALEAVPDLPAKFGFAVDTGAAPVLSAISADIRLERAADGRLLLRADGAATGGAVRAAAAPEAALALARWFVETGGITGGRGRMAAHLAAGAPLPEAFQGLMPAAAAMRPEPGMTAIGALVGFEFGQMRAQMLTALASLGAALRVTPWRMLLIEGASGMPRIEGLITSPADPRLRVTACTGAPGCPQALGPTRSLARALAAFVPPGAHLHVSGCTKGCAHPHPASVTLVAAPDGLALIRQGRASDTPARRGLAPEMIVGHPETLFEAL